MSRGAPPASSAASDPAEELRRVVRQLVLMKETGPPSAAWQRARLRTIWRLQRRLRALEQRAVPPSEQPSDARERC